MPDIGTPMTETIPAVGSSGTQYATDINAFLTEVQSRLEALLPKSSLDAGDLDMDGYAVQNASYVGIADAAEEPTTPVNTFQAFDGEIYWISVDGPVKLTSGGVLNSAAVGGITGDYGSPNPAELRFVDADQTYYAYDNFGTGAWAYIRGRALEIAAGATSANRVRVDFDGPSSYTLTLPDAVPAATEVVQMDSAGDLDVSGVVQNVRHADLHHLVSPWAGSVVSGTFTNAIGGAFQSTSAVVMFVPVQVRAGDRLKSFSIALKGDGAADVTIFVDRITATYTTDHLGSVTVTNQPASWSSTTIDLTDTTINAGDHVVVQMTISATGLLLGGIDITYDRP